MKENTISYIKKEMEKMFPKERLSNSNLDYSIIDKHIHEWEMLSNVGKCAVFVFDCFTHRFLYASEFGLEPFGLNRNDFLEKGHEPAFSLVHTDDVPFLMLTRKKAYAFLQRLSSEEIFSYKLIHEFRFRNINNQYIRITEQEQVISLDEWGNIWLTLSVFNIDAGNKSEPIKSHIYNTSTGEQIFIELSDTLEETLTHRETEILRFIRDGLLSKEISDRLGISINTVNVHRQNIFNKLHVDNAIEAINTALALGLLN